MFKEVFLFELRQRLKSKSTWICLLLLLLLVYRDVMDGYWDRLMGTGRVARNSAYASYYILLFSTFWTNVLAAVFFTGPFLRDIKSRMASVVYSTRVSEPGYFWGKYLASLCTMLIISTGSVWGFATVPLTAHWFHFISGEYGPVLWGHLTHAWLLIVLPAVLLHGAVHSLIAVRTGKLAGSYVYCIVHTMMWVVFMIAYPDVVAPRIVQIFDPIGKTALEGQLFYWSAEQRISHFLLLNGPLLWNRILTLAVFVIVLLLAARSFSFSRMLGFVRSKGKRRLQAGEPIPYSQAQTIGISPVARSFRLLDWARAALRIGGLELTTTLRHPALRIVLVIGIILAWMSSSHLGSYAPLDNGIVLPVAGDAFPLAARVFFIAILIAMLYYSGEIFSRERTDRTFVLVGASAVPDMTLVAGKAIAIVMLSATLSLVPVIGYLLTQLSRGFFHPQFSFILSREALNLFIPMVGFGAFAAAMHAIIDNRSGAHALTMLGAVSIVAMSEVHVLENLLFLPFMPIEDTLVSAFGILGQEYERVLWFDLYWILLTATLIELAWWFAKRGFDRAVRQRTSRILITGSIFSGIILFALFGAVLTIHRLMDLENHYQSRASRNAEAAAYEKKYAVLRSISQPRITNAQYHIDLFNARREANMMGNFVVRNDSAEPIRQLHLEVQRSIHLVNVSWNNAPLSLSSGDEKLRHFVYDLPSPLQPGQSAQWTVNFHVRYSGFANEGFAGTIVRDGTIIPPSLWPRIGYDRERELDLDGDRRRWGLPERAGLPSADEARQVTAYHGASDRDRFTWSMTVTADAGQVINAPGDMTSPMERNVDGRNIYRFQTSVPAPWSIYLASAKYRSAERVWQVPGKRPVNIQVAYHPEHSWNVERYLDAAEFALASLTNKFGEYPYSTLRIVEVPGPFLEESTTSGNLVLIPEFNGWTNDYRHTVALDWIQLQIAREISRAWWGQKIAPSEAQGANLITKGVPDYLGLEVLAERQGETQVRARRLTIEDKYLRTSSLEDGVEPSLKDWDDQEYLTHKAPIALYAVRERIGRDRLLRALVEYLDQSSTTVSSTLPNSNGLIDNILKQTPDEAKDEVVDDLKRVSVYDASLGRETPASNEGRVRIQRFTPVGKDNRAEVANFHSIVLATSRDNHEVFRERIRSSSQSINIKPGHPGSRLDADPDMEVIDRNRGNNSLQTH